MIRKIDIDRIISLISSNMGTKYIQIRNINVIRQNFIRNGHYITGLGIDVIVKIDGKKYLFGFDQIGDELEMSYQDRL